MALKGEVMREMRQKKTGMNYGRRQVMVKAAKLYYDENLTQAEIGERLGISRVTVNRILRDARHCEVVEIRIKDVSDVEPRGVTSIEGGIPDVVTVDVREQILQITQEMYNRGWITATGGNVSARTEEGSTELWITPKAIFKGDLQTDMLVRFNVDGEILSESAFVPSSEWRLHTEIYKSRSDVQAVIHTHAPKATILALTGTPFQPISAEAAFIGDLPVVPFIMPGTIELGQAVAETLGVGIGVLMQNHGLVVVGTNLRQAANMTSIIESTADAILGCKSLGITPSVLPDEVVVKLKLSGLMKG